MEIFEKRAFGVKNSVVWAKKCTNIWFLERKKKHLLEEEVTTTRQDNNVCMDEAGDILNKNVASSMQTYPKEDETVEGDYPLDLNPTPSYP